MTREEAKNKFDNFGHTFTLDEARLDTHILIDEIYDAHEAELKAFDESYRNLSAQYEKDVTEKETRIAELEAMVGKMRCCNNCKYVYPSCYDYIGTCDYTNKWELYESKDNK